MRPTGIISIAAAGYGFVNTAEGEFFIPRSRLGGAMSGDTVEIAINKNAHYNTNKYGEGDFGHHGRKHSSRTQTENTRGRVTHILKRAQTQIVGRFFAEEPISVVVPDDTRIDHDFFVVGEIPPEIQDEDIVVLEIIDYPTNKIIGTGRIVSLVGRAGDPHLLYERLIAKAGVRTQFPPEALSEAREAQIDIDRALAQGYRDITERFVFTIDPADAKDFDDALSLDKVELDEQPAWRLGVHIADVSHYVEPESSLDLEARTRGTSIYLPDRVIPMLPHELSNDLCSLNPLVERLSMTCDLYLDEDANLLKYDLYTAIIKSDARLTYDQAQAILDAEGASNKIIAANSAKNTALHFCLDGFDSRTLEELIPRIKMASKFAKMRDAKRRAGGGIDFDTKEARVMLDDQGVPTDVMIRTKTDATQLVEEAMIFANEVVATHLKHHDYPCAYRNHDLPTPDGLASLVGAFSEFSWFSKSMSKHILTGSPKAFMQVLSAAHGRAEEDLVTMLCLRAMSRAIYSERDSSHYGLGLDAYCHFTSPIRRYPDLIVHRLLKRQLSGARPKITPGDLHYICEISSTREREAEELSRTCLKAAFAQYMTRFIGESFTALVTGVTQSGLFARLDNCAEGFVSVRALGDEYFIFDETRYTLTGTSSKRVFRLGERLEVSVKSTDALAGRIDFALVKNKHKKKDSPSANKSPKKHPKRSKKPKDKK
jgi:ribonuclease R